MPQQAHVNLEALRTRYPGIYTTDGGFYDAVDPNTGSIGHRRLVLDQSMIMAALDNALNGNAFQRYFTNDLVSWAARLYLGYERMSIGQ
jgi:Putative glucoamylase